MALEAGAETLLACGIGGKKPVRDGVFRHHAPTKMCENSTAFEISLVREMSIISSIKVPPGLGLRAQPSYPSETTRCQCTLSRETHTYENACKNEQANNE